jgi:carbamoyltransferase
MGLAPYGEPRYVELIYQQLIDVKDDGSFQLNMRYFDFPVGERMINRQFEALFGGAALPFDAPPEQKHLDLARSVQQVIEEVVLKIVRFATKLTGCRDVCLAGGVALNCVANGRLLQANACDGLWIQPAAGDAGGALGAAMLAWHHHYRQPRILANNPDAMQGALLGPQYSNSEIASVLQQQQLVFRQLGADKYHQVAQLLANGAVLGCFQGRMEFGPRALGNRSILADARRADMQQVLNLKIKQRESFRPFAPAVMAEHAADWFDLHQPSPYMLLVANVAAKRRLPVQNMATGLAQQQLQRSELPAVTHVDYSARVQTVEARQQPDFYLLLEAFYQLTGTPVLINTSFNVRGEPPVCSPQDAINGFLATDMDYLLLGDYLLHKAEQPESAIQRARQRHFVPD